MAEDTSTTLYNVASLLRARELNNGTSCNPGLGTCGTTRANLRQWAEDDVLQHCEALYCDMRPQPRSTIAVAFSPDGELLASTHGDHTIKLTRVRLGRTVRVLEGHRRTPWVVRFHPMDSSVLVSGSLDYEVRVWDVVTGACLHSHDFGRPIASLAFQADGRLLAVASGHKLYVWPFDAHCHPQGPPVPVLKTRRSMRAILFHPFRMPLMLSAEVNEPSARSSQRPLGSIPAPRSATAPHSQVSTPPAEPSARRMPRTSSTDSAHPVPWLVPVVGPGDPRGPDPGPAGLSSPTPAPAPSREPPAATVRSPVPALAAAEAMLGQQAAGQWGAQEGAAAMGAGWGADVAPEVDAEPQARASGTGGRRAGTDGSEDLVSLLLQDPTQPLQADPGHAVLRLNPWDSGTLLSARGSDAVADDITPAVPQSPTHQSALASPHAQSEPGTAQRSPLPDTSSSEMTIAHPAQHADAAAHVWTSPRQPAAEACTSSMEREARDGHTPTAESVDTGGDWASRDSAGDAQGDSTAASADPGPSTHASIARASSAEVLSQLLEERVMESMQAANLEAERSVLSATAVPDLARAMDEVWMGQGHAFPPLPRGPPHQGGPDERIDPEQLAIRAWSLLPPPAALRQSAASGAVLPPSMLPLGWEYPAYLLAAPGMGPATRMSLGFVAPGQPPWTMAAAIAASAEGLASEAPCRVKLRLWRISDEHSQLERHSSLRAQQGRPVRPPPAAAGSRGMKLEAALLTIPDAVLCSEMGVHFSPCGRFLAACTMCMQEDGPASASTAASLGDAYELRIYSLEPASFGKILRSRRIHAAHCLTSVQFSPTSQLLLLSYGRRHISLLRSLVADGSSSSVVPVHTILEIYRVSDLNLERVLPSAEDEVNAACFHPLVGHGLAYGTKEGRLRLVRHACEIPISKADGLQKDVSQGTAPLVAELMEADQVAARDNSDADE